MKKFLAAAILSLLPAIATGADGVIAPPWAYSATDPGFQREPDDGLPKHVPGSDLSFTFAQANNKFGGIGDWFPNEHPPMPDIVNKGRAPAARACVNCHLTSGLGHPTSGMAAGMPVAYFIQQVKDFQNGKRQSILPERTNGMATIAKALTDEEIKSAAEYYASLKPRHWVTVKESDMSPVTYVGIEMRHVKLNGGMEPIGQRIVEVTEDSWRTDMRDPHSAFIAYVPIGSVKKGEALVTAGGNGKTIACAVCHGPDLKGLGNVPGIAGRLPTYVARQLLDIKQGSRDGTGAQLMKAVVANLTLDDVLNIAAYTASREP